MAPGPVQDYPQLEAEQLRAPAGTAGWKTMTDGRLVLETFDDFGKARDPYHGLAAGSVVTTQYGIHPDDPATARFDTQWSFTFERGDWQVAIETECSMHCDSENFYLFRKLRATESAEKIEVLTKEWTETIPRGLL